MAELTEEQQKSFDDRLRELGMNPSQVVQELTTANGGTYVSNQPDHDSAVEPHPVTVNNVDDLKRLAGVPDADYDSGVIEKHHAPLEEWPQEKSDHAAEDLGAEDRAQLRDALVSYVYGHSDSVASYRTILNNHFFPMEAAAFAVMDVTVTSGSPLQLTANNGAYNYGIVTIEPGGQILVEADCTMTCQQMVLL